MPYSSNEDDEAVAVGKLRLVELVASVVKGQSALSLHMQALRAAKAAIATVVPVPSFD